MLDILNLELINYGIDGKVYKYDENTFVKICLKIINDDVINNINYIINNKPKHFVLINKIEYFNEISYCYYGELLNELSQDEYKVFHTIISHEDFNKIKNIEINYVKSILNQLANYYDFNIESVIKFIEQINNSNIKHLDMHPRNIMKDKFNNYKFIDLERIKING